MAENKKYKKRSFNEILEIKAFYDAGGTFSEIAATLGITRSGVAQIFSRNNIKTRKKIISEKSRQAMDNRRIILSEESLTNLYINERLSIQKIAEKLEVGFQTVRRNLQDYGIPTRSIENYPRSLLTAELLKTLYIDKKLTAAQIADRLDYSALTISNKLSRFGIKKRVFARPESSSSPAEPGANQPPDDSSVNKNDQPGNRDETKISFSDQQKSVTAEEISVMYNLHITSVRKLIKKKVFPNAYRQVKVKSRPWLVPIADLENFAPPKRGRKKTAAPTVSILHYRCKRAKKLIKDSHGYGKKEIKEMVELEHQGLNREEIAIRFRLKAEIVADLLDQIALLKPRPKKVPPAKKELKRLSEKELIELYVTEEFSTDYILKKLQTNYASLYINLRHYGIPLRDERHRTATHEKETLLYKLAIEESLPPQMIAERLKISEPYVRRKINEMKRRLEIPGEEKR